MKRRLLALCLAFLGCALAQPAASQPQPEPTAVAPVLDAAAQALAGYDEETGLWYPPDATRETYLENRDPAHPWIGDIQKAFKASRSLRIEVCALVADPKREVRASNLQQLIKQRRTMLYMLCAGSAAEEESKQREKDLWRENEARFEKARNATAARALSFTERRNRFIEGDDNAPTILDSSARLDRAFERFGLMPQAEMGVFDVLNESPYRGTPANEKFQNYLQRLFSRETSQDAPEPARYLMGSLYYLFFTNSLPEAKATASRVLANEALARWRTDNLMTLALLERLARDSSALKRLAQACPAPRGETVAYEGRPAGAYCFDAISGMASRSIILNGEKAPALLPDVMEEIVASEPANWWRRDSNAQYLSRMDAARGRNMAAEILRVPATLVPVEVRLDALEVVAQSSKKLRDFGPAVSAFDRYLDLLRYRPRPARPDMWARLTALPKQEAGPAPWLMQRSSSSISVMLGEKAMTLVESGDFARARPAIEEFLTNAFDLEFMANRDSGKQNLDQLVDLEGLKPEEREGIKAYLEKSRQELARASRDHARWAREYLSRYGAAVAKAGRRAEATRVASYLIAQPGAEHNLPTELAIIFYGAREKNEPLSPAATPWDSMPVADRKGSRRPMK